MAGHIRFNDSDNEYDVSNSEDELSENEQRLLQKARSKGAKYSDSEEEVFGVTNDSDEDEDLEEDASDMALSDVEGQDEEDDDGIPDSKAWGKNKKQYYSTDYVDADYDGYQANDIMQAEIEEQEALNLQNDLAKTLDDDDFALDFVSHAEKEVKEPTEEITDDVIKTDVSKLSKRQKMQLLMKESPEFFGLIEDHKNRMTVLIEDIFPIIKLYKEGKIRKRDAMDFLEEYHQIILNYSTNIQMYLLLKANKVPLKNHPIIKRLYQYRQLLSQMDPVFEEVIKRQLNTLSTNVSQIVPIESKTKQKGKLKLLQQKQESKEDISLKRKRDDDEMQPKSILKEHKTEKKKQSVAFKETDLAVVNRYSDSDSNVEEDDDVDDEMQGDNDQEDLDENAKRAITYQIAKNKGLTPRRKKEQRNPRVKHRNKFRKAQIRRKGAVREVRTELSRYSGEISGIKASVSKSIKIKS